MRKGKILQIGCENFGAGGRSVIIYNLTRPLCDDYRIDFLSCGRVKNVAYQKEIEKAGGEVKVYIENKKEHKVCREIKRTIALCRMIKAEKYNIVHINADDAWEAAKSLWIAQHAGVKKVVVHAHTTGTDKKINIIKRIILIISKKYVNRYANKKLACSVEAAAYLFGKKSISDVEIIKNGIDVKKYVFNEKKRKEIRERLRISENEYAVCSIGRLTPVKNPMFILEVIHELYNNVNNIRFYWIGEGELREKVEKKIKQYNMNKYTFLLGNREDINDLLQAMDVFILGSLYEGFGIVNLEAQANGIPGIISDAVPEEAILNDNFFRIPVGKGKKYWADCVKKQFGNRTKENMVKKIEQKDFDIEKSSIKLKHIYEGLINS